MPTSFLLCYHADGDAIRAFSLPVGQNPEVVLRTIERVAEGLKINVEVGEIPSWLPTPENIGDFLGDCLKEKEKAPATAETPRSLFPPPHAYEKN